ncbi:alpha/beta hydrolase [Saccharothrix sp. S26]|uniref:dienelactone hydrolase family protein n=1 Tax=Saccharothrix sp. S26 TaxID=2907215 RepID=UPI001F378CCC|nr:CocE/NonD family hydrolase [Saccharothrix sp. S26]MCE7000960.1 alpha/beta hydrolase [Saccharothrix sp. S26]
MFIDEDVRIPLDGLPLDARLCLPTRGSGVVVFARGGGSRDEHVARTLRHEHLGTVLVDLCPDGERDVPVRAGRLAAVVDWLADQTPTGGHPIGLFGADVEAAIALVVAAERPAAVHAVVACGGQASLAGDALTRVLAPTLFIVAERDDHPARRLPSGGRVEVVPTADQRFEEPESLDRVTRLTAWWFHRHVGTTPLRPATS